MTVQQNALLTFFSQAIDAPLTTVSTVASLGCADIKELLTFSPFDFGYEIVGTTSDATL